MTPERLEAIRESLDDPDTLGITSEGALELIAEIDRLRADKNKFDEETRHYIAVADRLEEKLAVAVDALEIYAVSELWLPAREALSKIRGAV